MFTIGDFVRVIDKESIHYDQIGWVEKVVTQGYYVALTTNDTLIEFTRKQLIRHEND